MTEPTIQARQRARRARLAVIALLIASVAPAAFAAAGTTTAENPLGKPDQRLQAIARQYFPADQTTVAPKQFVRLTRAQIDRTAATILPGLRLPSVSEFVSRDGLQSNYEFADLLSINAANSAGFSAWASAVADLVRKASTGVLSCNPSAKASTCATDGAANFVTAAFRNDAPKTRVDAYIAHYTTALEASGKAEAAAELVEIVLNSPHFLFRKETDTDKYGRLVPSQLLQAVTYTLADSPPEAFGIDSRLAAEHIGTGTAAAATIRKIMADPASRTKLARFLAAWLELKSPGEFSISREVFPEFTSERADQIHSDVIAFLQETVKGKAPSLKSVTQAWQVPTSDTTARLLSARSPAAESETVATPTEDRRLGVFLSPAFIASHSGPTDERPIKRGIFWVRKAMCMELEPPPKDLHVKLYDMKGATQRQRIEQSTAGQACIGCHKIINPFAFFMEGYDAIGRWRSHDNGLPIDTSIVVDFLDEQPQETKSPAEAIGLLTGSEMFKQCFVRQMFRFYLGRGEVEGDDPTLRSMFLAFSTNDTQDMLGLIKALVSSDRIVRRN